MNEENHSTEENHSEELLEQVVRQIRKSAIADYPGDTLLDSLANMMPESDRRSSALRRPSARKMIAVGLSYAALLTFAVGMILRSNLKLASHSEDPSTVSSEGHVAEIVKTPAESIDLRTGSVQIVSIDTTSELDRMSVQLDQLELRLQTLSAEVAIREVQSEAATLLAEYPPRQSTVQ